jgi:hypothetical protein
LQELIVELIYNVSDAFREQRFVATGETIDKVVRLRINPAELAAEERERLLACAKGSIMNKSESNQIRFAWATQYRVSPLVFTPEFEEIYPETPEGVARLFDAAETARQEFIRQQQVKWVEDSRAQLDGWRALRTSDDPAEIRKVALELPNSYENRIASPRHYVEIVPYFDRRVVAEIEAERQELQAELRARCDRREQEIKVNWEKEEQERAAEQRAEVEDRQHWIATYGSRRLQLLEQHELDSGKVYITERLTQEHPWAWHDHDNDARIEEPSDLSDTLVQALDANPGTRPVIVTSPPTAVLDLVLPEERSRVEQRWPEHEAIMIDDWRDGVAIFWLVVPLHQPEHPTFRFWKDMKLSVPRVPGVGADSVDRVRKDVDFAIKFGQSCPSTQDT